MAKLTAVRALRYTCADVHTPYALLRLGHSLSSLSFAPFHPLGFAPVHPRLPYRSHCTMCMYTGRQWERSGEHGRGARRGLWTRRLLRKCGCAHTHACPLHSLCWGGSRARFGPPPVCVDPRPSLVLVPRAKRTLRSCLSRALPHCSAPKPLLSPEVAPAFNPSCRQPPVLGPTSCYPPVRCPPRRIHSLVSPFSLTRSSGCALAFHSLRSPLLAHLNNAPLVCHCRRASTW